MNQRAAPGAASSRYARYAGVLLLAAIPRLMYLLLMRPPFESAYWVLSGSLLRSGSLAVDGVRRTDFEPLYPSFLAACRVVLGDRMFAVQLGQVGVASLGAVYLYRLAMALTGRPRVAFISAGLYAFYPLLIRQAAAASDMALITVLLVAFAYYFVTAVRARDAAIAGACVGLAVLTRSMVLPLVVCGAAILAADRRPAAAIAFSMAVLLMIAPLPIRNHGVNGSWWPTRSGMNLFIGNSPYTDALLPDDDIDELQVFAQQLVSRERPDLDPYAPGYDRAVDAFYTERALNYMRERPLRTIAQKLKNVLYFFSPRLVPYEVATPDTRVLVAPNGQVRMEGSAARPAIEVVAHAAAASLVLPAALAGLYLRRREWRREGILWCIVGTFVAVYAVYFPATRYRAPMEFVLFFYAGVGLDRWWVRSASTLSQTDGSDPSVRG